MSDQKEPSHAPEKRRQQRSGGKKKKKERRALSVRRTKKTIEKKKKAKGGLSICATGGASVVAVGGADGISVVCAGVDAIARSGGGRAKRRAKRTKSFRKMRVDWASNVAKIDGRTMTIQEAVEEGYMTSDGSTVGQTNGARTRVVNLF